MNGVAAYVVEQCAGQGGLVGRHAPLVKRIAHHLCGRLPDHIDPEDLYQAGMVGLLEAARKYEDGHGASFETFAGIRIRGAMLDEARKHDWTPRSVYRRARELTEAMDRVEHREGRDARGEEVAEELGVSIDEYHQALQDAKGHQLLSLDESAAEGGEALAERLAGGEPEAGAAVEEGAFKRALVEGINGLPERERLVMALYYDEEMNLREIGAVLGVTESRVCQIHGQALIRLRSRLGEWIKRDEK